MCTLSSDGPVQIKVLKNGCSLTGKNLNKFKPYKAIRDLSLGRKFKEGTKTFIGMDLYYRYTIQFFLNIDITR